MVSTPNVPKYRALILEDHEFQRRIGAQILKQCGAELVLEATNGAAAIEIINRETTPIDIVLCDLMMPGMDGLEFLRHIAESGNASSVILASGMSPSIIHAAELMAQNYGVRLMGAVEKPLSYDKLLPLILRHFGQHLVAPRQSLDQMPLAAIQEGIARRQFEPFFQPKVNMRTCALQGVEALMRWRHPERGLIPPGAFIPVMEEHGLISELTITLIEDCLVHCRKWRDAGLKVPVSVNVCVDSLKDTNLPDRLEAMTMAAWLSPAFLAIEITETTAMTDLGHSLETLARFRMRGFGLSIDDYGTGFSSMQQLTRIPFNELKIDQTFVTGSASQPVLLALLETSVTMAKRLNLKSVAEGVETLKDWQTIARVGCDIAQGYFIARPMPGDELPAWSATWRGPASNLPPQS